MTTELPKISLGDYFLKFLGRRRAVCLPTENPGLTEPHGYCRATKEPLLRALCRRRGAPLPPGYIYLEDILPSKEHRDA